MSTCTYVDFQKGSFELGCYVSGAKTVFLTESSFTFRPGAAYWLECGTTGGLRYNRVWDNNRVLAIYLDSSIVADVDQYHVGMVVQAYSDNYNPAQVSSFAFYDNVPAEVTGCGWRITRTSETTGSFGNGTYLFPSGWFDTIDYISSDLVPRYTAAANKIEVPADGWYAVSVYQWGSDGMAAFTGGQHRAALFKNGVAVQFSNPIASNNFIGYNGFGGSFTVYCEAGDELQPGYNSTWSGAGLLKADAGGLGTYWAGTFLGNQRAE